MAQYTVQQVVATGCTDALVAFRLSLPEPAWEVTAVQKTVLLDRSEVTLGSVLLQGRLRACYTVAAAPQGRRPPPVGAPLPPEAQTSVLHAPLRAVWAETPFCKAIALPDAEPGQSLTVTAAHVTAQTVHLAEIDTQGLFLALDDQSLLHLDVRLTQSRDLHTGGDGPPQTRPPGRAVHSPEPAASGQKPGKAAFTRFQFSTPR